MNGIEYFPYCLKKNSIAKLITFFLITTSLSLLLLPAEQAHAVTTITWGAVSYHPGFDDAFGNIPIPITFTVDDTDLAGNTIIDTINVLITSSVGDSTTVTLVEDIADNGMFTNTKLIFMTENAKFGISDTGTITIFDDCSVTGVGNCDPNAVETLIGGSGTGVTVGSNSEPGGIGLDLTETGTNTGIFTTTLKFSTISSDPLTSTLLVSPGDTITVLDEYIGKWASGLIVPASVGGGAVQVVVFGTVTASYNGISQSVIVDDDMAGAGIGRGGGGAVRPGLVLNFIFGSGGVLCSGDCTKPTLGLDSLMNRIVEKGFSYNGNAVDVEKYYTPYPLITTNVGQKNVALLKIYDNGGPENVRHVSLAFGLSKGGQSISESKAMIKWDKSFSGLETVIIKDPENALQDVSVETEIGDCSQIGKQQCLIVSIFHTFRQSLGFNIVGTDVWDSKRNSKTNFYNDGIEIVGESLNPPKQITILDYRGYPEILTLTDKDNAIDENGNSWFRDGEFWILEENHTKRLDDPLDMHGIDRDNNMNFVYKKGQEILAEETLKELLLGQPIQNLDFGKNNNKQIMQNFDEEKHDLFLQQRIDDEIKRAEISVEQLFDIKSNY